MEQIVLSKLDNLIKEGINFEDGISLSAGNYLGEPIYHIDDENSFWIWKNDSELLLQKYTDIYKHLAFEEKTIKEDYRQLLNILSLIKKNPEIYLSMTKNSPFNININNTNTQTQTQSQELVVSIILEAIKEELGRNGIDEIKSILEEYKGQPEEIRIKLIDKIKGFGANVASGIVANIIMNPSVLGLF